MARAENTEFVDLFEEFYRDYYRNEIGELAQKYPNDQKSLFVDWQDLYRFDPDLAEDYRNKPEQLQEYAEEALRLFDLPIDVKLGQAHVRMTNLPESTDIREIRADHRGQLVSIQGIIRKATEVRPKITDAAFECQRCGTLSRIPQSTGDFQEPHECQGCERQGPFRINFDQSEFIDAQKLRVQESPEGLRGGETPQNIDVNIEDDITGEVTAGDHVRVTGVLKLDQRGNDREKSPMFDVYMDGVDVEIEDEEFEEMDIDEDDKKEIVALSEQGDIYEQMTASIAPSIYGYDQEKLAIALQLFSGVTKHLPDESRIRGDLHVLLIGDPGTGKCLDADTNVQLADGTTKLIGDIVESNLDDPKPVDDGVWDHASIPLPTLAPDGSLTTAEATKVWKRETPEHLYRIRTESGRELDVTPSHPLFVQQNGTPTAVEAEKLEEGQFVATPRSLPAAGDDRIEVDSRDVVPMSGETLHEIRESLALSQSDCGVSREKYQHYERGDRNPSRKSLRAAVDAFEERLAWLKDQRDGLAGEDWETIVELRDELGISQQSLADGMDVTQTAISYYERNKVAPDGGETVAASGVVRDRLGEALAVESTVDRLRDLATNDVRWDRIASIETVEPDDEWVYDLEVEGTHSYVSNGVVSHNSQILQYIRHIAPRSVFTSGKGSSSAGLCVTGDTRIHTEDGFREIRDLVAEDLPEPVATETAAEREVDVQTFDREDGEMDARASSHVWRMPEKPTRRIETEYGKELEASVNTPVLTCGGDGIEWTEISDVEAGDFIAAPRFEDLDRTEVDVREFLALSTEKVRLTEESIEFFRTELTEEFGTLRDAAAALDLSEDFIYLHLKNRHVPLEKLDRMLEGIDAMRSDVDFERLMVRHGESITIPETFDADLMYLLGLVFGDGDISLDHRDGNRGMVRLSNGDEALLERAADIFESKFDKRPEIERQDDRVPCIRVNSVTIARLFENAGMETPKEDLALASELTAAEHGDAFLRGLMDADGSVSVRGERGGSSVLLSTISERLAEQVQLMLESYGVKARRRERDRRGTSELANGHKIESGHVQYFLELYGADIDRYAEAIGFESVEKQTALEEIVREERRQRETVPVGSALAAVEGVAGDYYQNVNRGDNPGRARARSMLADIDRGPVEPLVEEAVEADLRWEEVVAAVDTGEKEVFDLTVPETHNFLGNGLVTHNTAAAVRDDFGDGQQWTLEAGALVLADRGIAAVDELDKMRCVAGDTLVQAADGQRRIRKLAIEAAKAGSIEELPNGRTIRDVDLDVWTMTDDETLTRRPVTAIHEYDAPETLYEVTLSTGEAVTVTPDHPFFIEQAGGRVETPAEELQPGDQVYVPERSAKATDGGTAQIDTASDRFSPVESESDDIGLRTVEHVESVPDHDYDSVYDLTVEGTHNFLANGMVVHNSEDRSAMHEALEQQSYHPDFELLLADGRRVEIGEFVDERMAERSEDVIDGVDCEILPVEDVRVHSADLDDNDVQKLPVDRVSRHEAPEEFVRVSFSNGREVVVTPEHPMFVESDDEWDTVPASDVSVGTPVPAPVASDGGSVAQSPGSATGMGTETITDVETLPNEGEHATDWVYDVTVEPTNTFVSQGVVLHNSISISKAGINATLKSRCSLLGAANPKYGRFDQYEPIGEQIDLEPALISRFDLIFTVTDQPDEEEDAKLAEHILRTNYAGELNTHREQNSTPDYSAEEVDNVTDTVAPEIDPELLRKYVAYAKRSCFPTMTEEAKAAIRDFYVELRTKGSGEDAPVPVTARKLEALVRLAEASARVRLSDTVEEADAERVIGIVRSSLEDIGIDPETGELDADVVETGTSKSQRDRIKNIRGIISDIEEEYDEGAPVDVVIERAEEVGMEASKAEHEIEKLKQQGEVYEPRTDHLRTT
ncbi:LAGLIDADG family homing endonuclease [Halorhabdus amylolytica]|uniref:LAGLIDADG family homing endonuclease n=1 Tax=Halorhabdus amylolytica TaxID=2559573 RepID=UPI0020BF3A07|nr:LAGLIDADG family homing endonuclease [Halorhabdus amylolytica]